MGPLLRFKFKLEAGMGKFGLLSVRKQGYNSAFRVWQGLVDMDVEFRLSKPVALYGRIYGRSVDLRRPPVNDVMVVDNAMVVDNVMVKWSVEHDGRLASGVGAVNEDGVFHLFVPSTDGLRIAAWADDYLPTKVNYSDNADDPGITYLPRSHHDRTRKTRRQAVRPRVAHDRLRCSRLVGVRDVRGRCASGFPGSDPRRHPGVPRVRRRRARVVGPAPDVAEPILTAYRPTPDAPASEVA